MNLDDFDLYWILDAEHRPVEATNEQWFEFRQNNFSKCIVAKTQINDHVEVSTVFIGMDQAVGTRELPVLFESMVFTDDQGGECHRYCSWDDAEAGHNALVKRLQSEQTFGRKLDL